MISEYKNGEVKVKVGRAHETDNTFPKKIIIRYPVFVRVFTFFLKTNGIIERFKDLPNPVRDYFNTLGCTKRRLKPVETGYSVIIIQST